MTVGGFVVHRVRVAKDKAEFVRGLVVSDSELSPPFQTYADVLAFAAALGMQRQQRSPFTEVSNREPAPISLEIFVSRGYDRLFKLLAVVETGDPNVLSPTAADAEKLRVQTFEEYANGGLEILQGELRGAIDYTEQLLLVMSAKRFSEGSIEDSFDLRRFL
ncbi:MAG: DNA phosphorothioation-associated protein 4 [Cyanobacteria bacterium SID2]|nr:DNA phosphorothioation-associated protein 4 [Cyanobacteria bacterium SID2]MBP0003873.1 DNA phosphorothioation-associated protein 4 [Cyanobacteria bacterium SBC]